MEVNTPSERRSVISQFVQDWALLLPGDFVTVRGVAAHSFTGWVDDITEDGAVIWIVQSHGLGRRMLVHEDGFQIAVEVPLRHT